MDALPIAVEAHTEQGKSRLLDLPRELLGNVLDRLDPFSLWRATVTCHELYNWQREFWNVDKVLARYVEDPIGFRGMMEEYDAVISGEVALELFERKECATEMGLTVALGRYGHVEEYLTRVEGYEVDTTRGDTEDALEGEFYKEVEMKGMYRRRKVSIVGWEDTRIV